jgi:hypothetical protein
MLFDFDRDVDRTESDRIATADLLARMRKFHRKGDPYTEARMPIPMLPIRAASRQRPDGVSSTQVVHSTGPKTPECTTHPRS